MALPLAALGIAAGAQLVGGALGAYGDYKGAQSAARNERRRQDMINRAYDSLTPYYKSMIDQLPMDQQIAALRQWSPAEMGEFDDSGYNVESYLDPSMAYEQEQAARQLQASQSASGVMMSGAAQKQLQEAYPEALLENAKATACFGGTFDFGRMNFLEKMIVKKVARVKQSTSKVDFENVQLFSRRMDRIFNPFLFLA